MTGMNTRFTPLPNFDRPSLTEEDLSGNSWNPLDDKEEQTLLILLKPSILIQNEEEERAYPGLNQAVTSGFGG